MRNLAYSSEHKVILSGKAVYILQTWQCQPVHVNEVWNNAFVYTDELASNVTPFNSQEQTDPV